ncbi:MAG: restriction endonuclease subunit S [Bacteroidales bacterium]
MKSEENINSINDLPNDYKPTPLGPLPEDWEVVKIQNLVEFERGSEPGSKSYNDKGKGIRFLRVSDISGNREEFIFTTSNNIKKCLPDDILITFDGSPGIVKKGFSGAFSSGIRKINIISNFLCRGYTFYVLQADFVQKVILKHSTGVTIKHASKAIPHILIPLPPLEEQKKIAYVLSVIQ